MQEQFVDFFAVHIHLFLTSLGINFKKIITEITCRAKKFIRPLNNQLRVEFSTHSYLTGTSWLASCVFCLVLVFLFFSSFSNVSKLALFVIFLEAFLCTCFCLEHFLLVYMIKIVYK